MSRAGARKLSNTQIYVRVFEMELQLLPRTPFGLFLWKKKKQQLVISDVHPQHRMLKVLLC